MNIPVTFGDLYRAYILEKEGGKNKPFFQVYRERCKGWMFFPGGKLPFPVPKSRMPCYNFDEKKNLCRVHGKAQYVTCGAYPEELLLDAKKEPKAVDMAELSKEFADGEKCLRGVELNPVQEKRTWEIAKLRSDEIHITGMTLNHPLFPVISHPSLIAEAEPKLLQIIKLAENKNYKDRFFSNVGQTQERYMELFGVKKPNYAKLLF
jgi:hypothetical protein